MVMAATPMPPPMPALAPVLRPEEGADGVEFGVVDAPALGTLVLDGSICVALLAR